jgi:hypothetical protein
MTRREEGRVVDRMLVVEEDGDGDMGTVDEVQVRGRRRG